MTDKVDGFTTLLRLKAGVLINRGKANTEHDIQQAADYLKRAAAIIDHAAEVEKGNAIPVTILDQFALAALPAVIRMCAGDLPFRPADEPAEEYFALKSYEVARAMVKERAK